MAYVMIFVYGTPLFRVFDSVNVKQVAARHA